MRWSVGIEAESGRILTREQVVDLADAVAEFDGIATGIGTTRYGAQLLVDAPTREAAIETGTASFRRAAASAGLPEAPIVRAEAISEAEDQAEFEDQAGVADQAGATGAKADTADQADADAGFWPGGGGG